MRCVNCGRRAAPDDSACPYCGCPVLSRHADPVDERRTAEVRRLFDEAAGRPALHVVPFRPEAPSGPNLADTVLVLVFWMIAQAIPWLLLGVADVVWAWAIGPAAAILELTVLRLYGARPWFRRPEAPKEENDADRSAASVHPRVSGL